MGTLAVDNIQHTDGSSAVTLNNAGITTGTLGSGVAFPAGHVIQTKYVIAASSDVYTTTNGSWNAYVTNLALSITRTAGTKFIYMVFGGRYDNEVDSRIFREDVVRSDGASWSGTNIVRFGHSSYGMSSIGSGDAGEKNHEPQKLVAIDTTSISGDYTYQPVFTGTDGGGQYFNMANGGTQIAIGIEFIG